MVPSCSLRNHLNLSDIHDDEPGRIEIHFPHNSHEIEGRISGGAVPETKGSPLGRDEIPGTEVPECLQCLKCVHVSVMHEPAGMVGGHREERITDVRKSPSDFPVADEITAVRTIVNRGAGVINR